MDSFVVEMTPGYYSRKKHVDRIIAIRYKKTKPAKEKEKEKTAKEKKSKFFLV